MAGSVQLNKHFGIQGEALIRLSDFQQNQQHEFHIGADIPINKHITITPVGYGYFLNYVYGGLPAAVQQNEHRLWQQIVYKTDIKRVHLNLRFRAEEDWREHKVKNKEGLYHIQDYTFKPRLRPRFLLNIALNRPTMDTDKVIYLSMWQEMYIAVGPKVTYHLPEENRAYIGLGYKPVKWVQVTLGYMHQLIIRSNGTQAESNHTLVAQAILTPKIHGKKQKK
ncbi:MAG: hypothetical protein JWO03_1261 [Bacteroidetes bacterium]|nr:hypothetical protein [Bacteroidota bacterium]